MERYNYYPDLRTCHDVRHLAGCTYCNGLGDSRHMVPFGKGREKYFGHGRCFIAKEGMEAFLRLPEKTTDTLFLCDIGNEAMKALMNRGRK